MKDVDILLVDDDLRMVENLKEVFEEEGLVISAFDNPLTALGTLKKKSFALALVDLVMPKKSGLDILRAIKDVSPDTKVIIITGFATVESAVEAMKAGAADYITKPFKINEIQNVVRRILEEIRLEKDLTRIMRKDGPDRIIKAVSSPVRMKTVLALEESKKLRFTDIKKALDIDDPTKLSFHLRELKESGLLMQDTQKSYFLSDLGLKIARLLKEL